LVLAGAIAHSNFETAKKLGWFDLERSGDPDSQPFNQIGNPDTQRIRNNPHRPQRDVPLSPLDSSNVRTVQTRTVRKFLLRPSLTLAQFGFSPQLFGSYPSPERSPPGSFEFVLGFERLDCQDNRGQAGALEDPLILLGGRRVTRRISDERQPAHTPSDPARRGFRCPFFPAAFRFFFCRRSASSITPMCNR
jgi:hypothetical protein